MSFNIALRRGGPQTEEIELREVAATNAEVLHINMQNIQIEYVLVEMIDADGRTIITSTFDGRDRRIAVAIPADARHVRVTGSPWRTAPPWTRDDQAKAAENPAAQPQPAGTVEFALADGTRTKVPAFAQPDGSLKFKVPADAVRTIGMGQARKDEQKPFGLHELGHPVSTMGDAVKVALGGEQSPTRIAISDHENVIIDELVTEMPDDSESISRARELADYRALQPAARMTRGSLMKSLELRGDKINELAHVLGSVLAGREMLNVRAADLGRAARAAHQAGEKARDKLSYAERSLVARENDVARLERDVRSLNDDKAEGRAQNQRLIEAKNAAEAEAREQAGAADAWRERAETAEAEVRTRDRRIEDLNDSINAKNGRLRELEEAIDVQAEELTKARQQIEELSQRHAIDHASAEAIDALLAEHGADMTGMTLAEALRAITAAYAERGRQNAALQDIARTANLRGGDAHDLCSEETQRADRAERKLKRERKRSREARQAQHEAEKSRDRHLLLQARAVEITNRTRKDLAEMTEHRDSLNARIDEEIEERDAFEHDLTLAREEVEQVRGALRVAEGLLQERDAKLDDIERQRAVKLARIEVDLDSLASEPIEVDISHPGKIEIVGTGATRSQRIAKVVDHVQDTGRDATIGGVELTKRKGTVIGHATPEQTGASAALRKLYDGYVDDVLGGWGGVATINEGATRAAKIADMPHPAYQHVNAPCSVEPVLTADGDRAEADRLLALVRRVAHTGQARLTHGIMVIPGEQYAHLRDVNDNRPVSLKTHQRTVRNLRRARADRRTLREMLAAVALIANMPSAK